MGSAVDITNVLLTPQARGRTILTVDILKELSRNVEWDWYELIEFNQKMNL